MQKSYNSGKEEERKPGGLGLEGDIFLLDVEEAEERKKSLMRLDGDKEHLNGCF